jgi:thioredoxin-related protein
MKSILAILIFFISFSISGQGIKFFEGSWHEALQLARKENKIIFVDAYTPWCHPCKKLKKDIFPQKAAGDFYNANFINMSIDLEKWRGLVFTLYYDVNAYPTLLFIDPDGKAVLESKGFKNVTRLIKLGKKALKASKNLKSSSDDNKILYSHKAHKIFKKLKKAESKQNYKKYKKYALRYFNLLESDNLKRDFIKSIYSKNIKDNDTDSICYNLSVKLYNESKTKSNNIFLIKMLVLTKHYKDAYKRVKKALREADNNNDIITRIELRRYKKYLDKKNYLKT